MSDEAQVLVIEDDDIRPGCRQIEGSGGLESRIIGRSPAITELRAIVQDVAAMPTDVTLLGETGTGKELIARCLHDLSGRRGPFVALNCGGLPEALFESEIFGHEAGAFSGASRGSLRAQLDCRSAAPQRWLLVPYGRGDADPEVDVVRQDPQIRNSAPELGVSGAALSLTAPAWLRRRLGPGPAA
jgi:hypothetical protein